MSPVATALGSPLAVSVGSPLVVSVGSPTPAPTASVQIVTPPPADKTGVGWLGFLIVVALLLAAAGLFIAMRGSLRRLQQRDLEGTFGASDRSRPGDGGSSG